MEPQQMENNNQNKDNNMDAQNTPPAAGGVPLVQEKTGETKIQFHPEDKIIVTPLRTYADDVKHAISDDGVSVIKIAMAEAKKQEQEVKDEEEINPQSNKNITIILASFVFIALGVAGVFGVWYFMSSNNNSNGSTAVATEHYKTLIPYDEAFPLVIKDGERREVIDGQKQATAKVYQKETSLVYIPLSNTDTSSISFTTEKFLTLLQTRMSDPLVRAFGQNFMFGLYKQGDGTKPYILLNVDSLSTVYAGMLAWEPAMADDIGDIFFSKDELVEQNAVATSTILNVATSTPANLVRQDLKGQAATTSASSTVLASSTKATGTQVIPKSSAPKIILADSLSFRDEVVNNRDVRALRTKGGKLLMFYSFVSDNLLVIGRDLNIISEVSKRLATSQFKQ